MRNIDEHNITDAVIARFAGCTDERLKEVLSTLVRHLHAFVRETRLSESEWMQGIEFLTATGHMTDAKRQEFILLSDTLGVSMLTVAQNHSMPAGTTEATVFGPFHVETAPEFDNGADIAAGAPGEPLFVDCTIRGSDGAAIAGATVDVWQADQEGFYDVQYKDLDGHRARGVLHSDGHPCRPAHVHFRIQAPGYETLTTHVFRAGDPYLDSDVVFGVRSSLISDFVAHPAGTGPHAKDIEGPYHSLDFAFVLQRSAPPTAAG